MSQDMHPSQSSAPRRPWLAPRVDQLPRLTDLTLQSGGIPASCEDDPSSCFG